MQLLNEDLIRLVEERTVDPAEAYQKSIDKNDMANKLRTASFQVPGPTQGTA
jgi:hypothetical protein